MASLNHALIALLAVLSFCSSTARPGELTPVDPPRIPKCETDTDHDVLSRDFASWKLTLSLGLPTMSNLLIPPLSCCYVMNLLCNATLLPPSGSVKRKCNVSSSLCRILIVLLLIIFFSGTY